ncbi:MAG: hypothetical protein J4N36_06845 [Chloroflexi bacterium]|nr:hypothetical protein [Chloroflexota bacterium]MCI0832208.1 hypothetical protein [Chloroflexota bacterium]MCI0843463.1 hypothetical protein [Chloroflexota bacterium]MCI0883777.1 hypothetical protein [Chloroflexota bacterium]MCI0885944.1 hypothetical protein [Chloroflexota bacterium]
MATTFTRFASASDRCTPTVDVTGGLDKTEGGLDLFVAYSTDEAVDRCRCVFSTLKSALDERQPELISIHLPDSIQQIYTES